MAAGATGVLLLALAWLRHRREGDPARGELLPRVQAATALLLLAGAALVGFCSLGVRAATLASSGLTGLDGRVVVVEGLVATDPDPAGEAWRYHLKSVAAQVPDRSRTGGTPRVLNAAGRLAVTSWRSAPAIDLGDRVRTEVQIARLDLSNPFDERLRRLGVTASAEQLGPPEVLASTPNPVLAASNHFRRRMQQAVSDHLDPDRAGLLLGLVIGDDRTVSDEVEDDFRAAGLSHLTAVSGSNLAMVLGALALVMTALRVPRRAAVLAGLAAIVLFTVVTRWEPSVLRAAVMASMALAAFLFGRISSPSHAIGAAFAGLLAFDPHLLWSVGFQLSFAATAGILWLRPPLIARLTLLPRPVAEAVAIGLSAQVAVAPLIALHFERFSVAAVPANLAAFALVAPITVLGFAAGLIALVSGPLAAPVVYVAGWLTAALQTVSRLFGRSTAAEIEVPHFGATETAAAYLVIAGAWLLLARRPQAARWPAAIAALLLVGATLAPALGTAAPHSLRITFFDVGEGDAALIESPEGARILIDGGPDPAQVGRLLRRRGLGRVDLVIASHLHGDHVRGIPAVLRSTGPGLVLHPGVDAPLLATLTAEAPEVRATGRGETLRIGDVSVEVLGPTPDLREIAALSVADALGGDGTGLNDASAVVRINWAGECVLFTGDVEEAGQLALLDLAPERIDCTVMKAPHHGSGRLLADFVRAVDPEWVPVSVGRNVYGHPTAKALAIFEAVGARVLRTDTEGDVVIDIDSAGRVGTR